MTTASTHTTTESDHAPRQESHRSRAEWQRGFVTDMLKFSRTVIVALADLENPNDGHPPTGTVVRARRAAIEIRKALQALDAELEDEVEIAKEEETAAKAPASGVTKAARKPKAATSGAAK